MDEYDDIERVIREVDFTKGSDHKIRLREKLFPEDEGDFSGELGLDEMRLVRAAVKKDAGMDTTKEGKDGKKNTYYKR